MNQPRSSSVMMVFLFTDLVDSTGWKQSLGDVAYADDILQPHNDLFRRLLREFPDAVERNFTGDGFLVTTASPSAAVHISLRFHDALRRHIWSEAVMRRGRAPETRIGIHAGEAIAYADADPSRQQITGQAVDLAARIMGLAAGQQTLLTRHAFDSARQYVRQEGLSWLAHGDYRCKGSDEPLEVCEVGEPGLAPLAPPSDSEKAKHVKIDPAADTGAWRPAVGLPIPRRDYWTIEKKIGEGGFGEVWLARHQRTREGRVFKFCFDAGRLQSFKRELTFFRLIKNALGERPDIAKLYEVNVELPPYSLESEYIEAGSFAEWIQAQGGLHKVEPRERLRLMAQIARAVAAAHSLGIIHKDLKPSNILIRLDKQGAPQPVLSDFGIGILSDRTLLHKGAITEAGFTDPAMFDNAYSRTGTRLYSPPEASLGKPATTGFDIYALGVMLFQMATGEVDRPLGTGWEVDVKQECAGDWVLANLIVEDVTAATRADAGQRLASAAALAERLENLEGRRKERFAEIAREEQERSHRERERRMRRLRWVTAASLLVLCAMTSLAVVAWNARNQAVRAEAEEKARSAELVVTLGRAEEAEASERTRAGQLATSLQATDAALFDAEHNLSNGNVLLAQAAWNGDGPAQIANAYLDAIPARTRNIEWGYLKRHYAGGLFAFYGHTSEVTGVGISGDGSRIISSSADRVRVWDAHTGQGLLEWKGNPDDVITCAAISGDGERFAVGMDNTKVEVWNIATQRPVCQLEGHTDALTCVAFDADGKRVVSGSKDKTVRVWEVKTSKCLLELKGHAGMIAGVAISRDGTRIASGSFDKTARIWDAQTGKSLLELKGHAAAVLSVAFGGAAGQVVSGSADGTVRIWDAKSAAQLLEMKEPMGVVQCVALGPNGGRVASGSEDGVVRIWDANTGQLVKRLKGHAGFVSGVAFSPDGRWIVSGSHDKTLRLWEADGGTGQLELKSGPGSVGAVAFSWDGGRIATGGDKGVRVWDAVSGKSLFDLTERAGAVKSLALSPDGTRLASGWTDKTVRVWDLSTRQLLQEFRGNSGEILGVAFSPDGARIAGAANVDSVRRKDAGPADTLGIIRIWDLASGRVLREWKAHSGGVNSVAFSLDGNRVVSGGTDRLVRIWDAESGKSILNLKGHTGGVNCVAFSRDGLRIVSGANDSTVRVWDAHTGRPLLELRGHSLGVTGVALTRDGMRIVSGSRDKTVRVWDARSGLALLELPGHAGDVVGVALGAKDKRFVSGSADGVVSIWEARPEAGLLELQGHSRRVTCATFNRDGSLIATGSDDTTVRLWDARTGLGLKESKQDGGPVMSVQFSTDGAQVISKDLTSRTFVWDLKTDTISTDVIPHDLLPPSDGSPDGRYILSLVGRNVWRVDLKLAPDEIARRAWLTSSRR